jgi:hypothetical protein
MVEELILSGADIVKCGIGPGSINLIFFLLTIKYLYIRQCLYNTFENWCRLSSIIMHS